MAGTAEGGRAARDRAAVLRDPALAAGIGQFGAIQTAAPALGMEVSPVNVRDADEIERAVAAFAEWQRRSDRDGERTVAMSSRADHLARGTAQTARGLLPALFVAAAA